MIISVVRDSEDSQGAYDLSNASGGNFLSLHLRIRTVAQSSGGGTTAARTNAIKVASSNFDTCTMRPVAGSTRTEMSESMWEPRIVNARPFSNLKERSTAETKNSRERNVAIHAARSKRFMGVTPVLSPAISASRR